MMRAWETSSLARGAIVRGLALWMAAAACGCSGSREVASAPIGGAEMRPAQTLPFPGARRRLPEDAPAEEMSPNVVSYPEYNDPLMRFNRAVFAFNDAAYRYALIPIAKAYLRVTPNPAERGIGNFFYNIKTPIYAANHLAQLNFPALGRNLARFAINSTAGLLGFFDTAAGRYELKREETHFEDTLAHYGSGYGFYIVMPLIGPSDARNVVSAVVDHFLNPVPYILEFPASTIVQTFDSLQEFAPHAEGYERLRARSEDPYIFFRNLHLQGAQRDAEY